MLSPLTQFLRDLNLERCELDSQTRASGVPIAGRISALGLAVKASRLSSGNTAGSTPAGRTCRCGSNWIFAIARGNLVRRLTFSRELAELILERNPSHWIVQLNLVPVHGIEPSHGHLLGIVDVRSGKLLRATVSLEEARFLAQDSSRRIVVCHLRGSRPYA